VAESTPGFIEKLDAVMPDDGREFHYKTAIIGLSALVDPQMNPQAVSLEIENIIKDLRARLAHDPAGKEKIEIISKYLFEEKGFSCDAVQERFFLSGLKTDTIGTKEAALKLSIGSVLKNKSGVCFSLSFIYLAVAEDLYLPVYGVVIPGHFFLRYEDGPVKLEIDVSDRGRLHEDFIHGKIEKTGSNYGVSLDYLACAAIFLSAMARLFIDGQKMEEAAACIKKSVMLAPDYPDNYYLYGIIKQKSGLSKEAEDNFNKALVKYPEYGAACMELGFMHYMAQDYTEAEKKWIRA
jgi:regulator of sirC expression with transglutaminase-like and TPR domain